MCFCLSVFLPVCSARCQGLTFTFARVLVWALIDGPGAQPTDTEDHTLCAACALVPTLAVWPLHVCHRQRDSAVSIGSHMQQDMDTSKAPPPLSAPWPLPETVHAGNLDPKIGDTFSWNMAVLGACYNACFSAPPGARQSLMEAGEDDHETDNACNFKQNSFSEHEPITVIIMEKHTCFLAHTAITIVRGDAGQVAMNHLDSASKVCPQRKPMRITPRLSSSSVAYHVGAGSAAWSLRGHQGKDVHKWEQKASEEQALDTQADTAAIPNWTDMAIWAEIATGADASVGSKQRGSYCKCARCNVLLRPLLQFQIRAASATNVVAKCSATMGWRTEVLLWTSPDFGPSIHDGLVVTVFDYFFVRVSRRMHSAQPANYPCSSFEMSLSFGLWSPEVAQPAWGKRLPWALRRSVGNSTAPLKAGAVINNQVYTSSLLKSSVNTSTSTMLLNS